MLNLVLVEPEIPQNTGNIARTCAATHSRLHLVEPLGFEIDDRHVKRAGLDYWSMVEIFVYHDLDDFFARNAGATFHFASTKGGKRHSDAVFHDEDFIVFGKETAGLPRELLSANDDKVIRVPMREDARSLNLANSVAIVAYEALRQLDYPDLR